MFLFSYGSNSLEQLHERLGHEVAGVGAFAEGWQRVFRGYSQRWNGGVASLLRKPGGTTYGFIAEVTEADLKVLDRYEGVASGNYERRSVRVKAFNGHAAVPVNAIAYIATSKTFNPPSREYLKAVSKTVSAFWRGAKPEDFPIR